MILAGGGPTALGWVIVFKVIPHSLASFAKCSTVHPFSERCNCSTVPGWSSPRLAGGRLDHPGL